MEIDTKPDVTSPWNVESLENFLYYCCPECDMKQDTKANFIIHAVDAHPNSHPFIPMFELKDEKDFGGFDNETLMDQDDSTNIEDVNIEPIKEEDHEDIPEDMVKVEFSGESQSEPEDSEDFIRPKCEDCGKDFSSKQALKVHKKRFHTIFEQNSLKCTVCNEEFESKHALRDHKKEKHTHGGKIGRPTKYFKTIDPKDGIAKIKCEDCGLYFLSKDGILWHKRNHHGEAFKNGQHSKSKIYPEAPDTKCFLCSTMVSSTLLKKHMVQEHCIDGVYKCEMCLEVFAQKDREKFLFHLTAKHQIGEFRFKCDQCDKAFDCQSLLNKHVVTAHTKLHTVVCYKCGKDFCNQQSLNIHLRAIHDDYKITQEDIVKKCDKCAEEFAEPMTFDLHLKICLDEPKDHKCKFCETKWASHLSLEMHIAVDHKKQRKVCDICGHISAKLTDLERHKKLLHEKRYDFVCHLCAKPISTKKLLNYHLTSVHGEGERKFKCDQCEKTFVRASCLRQHVESHHLRSTLYQCEQCPKNFWAKSYLQTHIRIVHQKYRPHKCDICLEGFLYKRDVVRHKKFQHNIHE